MSTVIHVYEDTELRAGAVVVSVARADASAASFMRPGGMHLGPGGWQTSPHELEPRRVRPSESEADRTELIYGPEVTGQIEPYERITVSAGGVTQTLSWPEVSPDLGSASGGLWTVEDNDARTPDAFIVDRQSKTVVDDEIDEDDEDESEPLPPPPGTGEERTPSRLWWLTLLLIPLALAIAYLYWPPSPADERPAPTVSPTVQPATPERDLGALYTQYLEAGGHQEDLLALSNEAAAAGNLNLSFNALTLSADRGSVDAKMRIAGWYDPLEDSPSNLQPNPASALLYYEEARDAGSSLAASRIERLCTAASGPDAPPVFDGFETAQCP